MTDPRAAIFDAVRRAAPKGVFADPGNILALDNLLDAFGVARPAAAAAGASEEPRWLILARSLVGTREIPGAQHSPRIMGWIAKLGSKVLGITVRDDETPWCGTFVAHVMQESGIESPPVAVRASSWGSWGRELIAPRAGCVLVFTRAGGGHVGLYVGERSDAYRVLGGNQSNMVSEMWIAKSRLAKAGMRWPYGEKLPAAGRIMLANNGEPLSRNEA